MHTGLGGKRVISLKVSTSKTQLSGPGEGVLGSGRAAPQRVREKVCNCKLSDRTSPGDGGGSGGLSITRFRLEHAADLLAAWRSLGQALEAGFMLGTWPCAVRNS